MMYRKLIQAAKGRETIARELRISLPAVTNWSRRGLPRSYKKRVELLTLIKKMKMKRDLKKQILEWASDPEN